MLQAVCKSMWVRSEGDLTPPRRSVFGPRPTELQGRHLIMTGCEMPGLIGPGNKLVLNFGGMMMEECAVWTLT